MEVFGVLIVLGLLACLLVGFLQILLWIIRLLGGGQPSANSIRPEPSITPSVTPPRTTCNGCGAPFNSSDQFCMQCGLRRGAKLGAAETDLIATQRALLRLFNLKQLDENLYQSLSQTIEAEQARLRDNQTERQTVRQLVHQTVNAPAATTFDNLPARPAAPITPIAPIAPITPTRPPEPRRSLPEMLAAFMEESSIRWGELVGGVLIIGCSLALVVSLWSEIAERPVLKFSVFMSMTAALFVLGFYSARRWKLPTTSRGVMLIATLLVPLNFLAVTALGRASSGVLIVLAEIAAWFVFAALVWRGAQVYAAEHSHWIAGSTMGVSLALLAAKHLAAPDLNWRNWLLLGALPIACFVVSVAGSLRQARTKPSLKSSGESPQLYSLFAVLGTGLFATVLPLGLLLGRGGLSRRTWQELVPLLALLGVPLMAVGRFCWRRIQSQELGVERTIATSIGLAGAALLAGSTLLAFPFIDAMLVVALLNAVVFGWAAWHYGLRTARWLAFAQALYASLLLLHLALGNLQFGLSDAATLLSALFSYVSGVWLLIAALALLTAAELLPRRSTVRPYLRADAELAAAACALASFGLVTYHGFGWLNDPLHAVWIYATYAVVAFALAWRHQFAPFVWAGLGLLWMTSAQACVYWLQPVWQWSEPWAVAWLTVALITATLALLSLFNGRTQALFGNPSLLASGVCVLAVAPLLAFRPFELSPAYLCPGFIVALAWAFYAWRAAQPVTAVSGGLLFNLAASLSALSWFRAHYEVSDSQMLVRLIQINLAVSALYALAWYGFTRGDAQSPHRHWVLRLSRIIAALWLALLGVTAAVLIMSPWHTSQFVRVIGGGWGWALAALVAGTYALTQTSRYPNRLRSFSLRMLALLALGAQTAALVHRFETTWAWQAYFTLAGFVTLAALIAVARVAFASRREQKAESNRATLWTNGLSIAAVLLAWRGTEINQEWQGPWRSVVILFTVTLAMLVMQGFRRSRAYAYVAGALACGTLTMWIWGYAQGNGTPMDMLLLNGVTLAAIALISLLIELRSGAPAKAGLPAFHQFVAFALLATSSWWMATKLFHDFTGMSHHWMAAQGVYSLLFFAALAALLFASWWDGAHRWRFTAVYVFGLLVIAALIDRRNFFGASMLYCFSVVGTLYAVGAALLWRSRSVFSNALLALRIPELEPNTSDGLWWLTPANTWLAAISTALALFLSSVMEPSATRVLAAVVSLLAPLSLYLLITKSVTSDDSTHAQIRTRWLTLALAFCAVLACLWLGVSAQYTHQLVIFTALSLLVSGAFYLSEARPLSNWTARLTRLGAWEAPLRQFVNTLGIIGLTALIATLGLEWGQRLDFGAPQLATWAAGLVTALFVALLLSLLAFALWRGRDPLDWQGPARNRYVYGAEIVAVLLFIHVRLVAPWLFGGRFQAYWPIMILLLAFVGVFLGDLLRRRGRTVLADPLERTGVFLPLLPALAFALVPSRVDYAGVLLGVALFYGLLSIMRQSFGFGMLAILAGNGGWWHWLQRTGDFGFFAHPQVWLIPAALSVLVAAHLNRKQLSLEQLTTIRYVALMTIYVSSTADIFLNGVADSPWLPLVLAVLSIVGVMLGIMLRIRAYLILGTLFLLFAVITLVWHAAVSFGWYWLLYVAGIAAGMAIIYLFAMFERHRAAWLLWMERFKTWQA